MSRFAKLSTIAKSAVVALALGGAVISAAPAQAAPAPHFDFHFGFGGGGISIGGGKYCLADRQVRVFLRWQGYDHIRFFDRRGRIVGVRAEKGRWEYRLWVDTCRARIIDRQRIRRHH